MEIKKSPKANLEGQGTRTTRVMLGIVVVLALFFAAIELSEREAVVDTSDMIVDVPFEEELVERTVQEEPKQKPPEPKKPEVIEVINIVEDDVKVEETELQTTEETGEKVDIVFVPKAEEEPEPEEEEILMIAETMPEFPGGMGALMKYLGKNIKYPTIAQENGVQGRVIVQFVVNKDGSIVDPVVVRSVDPYLDKEALRVIKSMPKWKPGEQQGKKVRVKYTVPVTFRLQ